MIETAWSAGVLRLLFLGISCIYPKFDEQPIKEALLTGPLEPNKEGSGMQAPKLLESNSGKLCANSTALSNQLNAHHSLWSW